MGIAHGESVEFLLVKIFDRLEVIRRAVASGCKDPRRFEDLEECLAGKALQSFKRLVRDHYPNPEDKTNANYEELCMLMATDLGDQTYPGNKICQCALQKLKYMNFHRADDGRCKEPTNVLCRIRELRAHGSCLQHSFGAGGILTDDEFKHAFSDIFPNMMQDWLTNDQNIDPFNAAAPLDVDEMTNHFQRYWQL